MLHILYYLLGLGETFIHGKPYTISFCIKLHDVRFFFSHRRTVHSRGRSKSRERRHFIVLLSRELIIGVQASTELARMRSLLYIYIYIFFFSQKALCTLRVTVFWKGNRTGVFIVSEENWHSAGDNNWTTWVVRNKIHLLNCVARTLLKSGGNYM